MLRNSELKNLTRQLNKSSRTSLLKEDERKALEEGLKVNPQKETPTVKKKGRPKKEEKTNE